MTHKWEHKRPVFERWWNKNALLRDEYRVGWDSFCAALDHMEAENEQLKRQLAEAQSAIHALDSHNALLRAQIPELASKYYCFEQGCPGHHGSKYEICAAQTEQSPSSAPAEQTCEWKRVGDYKFKASCKGCTFQIRSDLEDMGNCPDCGAKIKVSR